MRCVPAKWHPCCRSRRVARLGQFIIDGEMQRLGSCVCMESSSKNMICTQLCRESRTCDDAMSG